MERVGRYEVLRQIGDTGGMADVFLAWEPDRQRDVALKRMDFTASDPQLAARFVREARFAEALQHPNIVSVYELFEHDGVPYIVMEYLERGSLRSRVRALTPPQQLGVVEGVLAGLSHAHLAGVVHRDLKPENLLIGDDGVIKIGDFGIAKAYREEQTRLTGAGMTVGTPSYMAPEQAHGHPVTPATDLYSLGALAYELVSGKVPFGSEAPMQLLFRKINENPPSLALVAPGFDSRIAAWVDRLLLRPPASRPQSAGEAWHALDQIVSEVYGPNWRRDARLSEPGSPPLPHAHFDVPDDADYKTFIAPEVEPAVRPSVARDEVVVVRRNPPPPPPRQEPPSFQQDSYVPPQYTSYNPGRSLRSGIIIAVVVILAVVAVFVATVVAIVTG